MDQSTNAIRCLAIDTVQKANSGHPGAPMGMAPMANVLFSEFLAFDPAVPQWHNRDRFVLSNGHASALLYSMLHLCGYALTIDDLKSFRQLNSKTPGHPENHVTPGVEVTTGPLGQGIANAVGIAIAEAHLAATFNKPKFPVVDHWTYVFCGDGCLMEGVAQEALSVAGHLGLEKLILIYDDNKITIDGSTDIAFTEKTEDKMRALGWHTTVVANGDSDYAAMRGALHEAKAVRGKPKMILLKTIIGYGSKLQGTEKVHGAPLGAEEIKRVKEAVFKRPADKSFFVEPEVYQHFGAAAARGHQRRLQWAAMLGEYAKAYSAEAAMYDQYFSGKIDSAVFAKLPRNEPGKVFATRKASENTMGVLLPAFPNLIGGSADLTHSNLTRPASVKMGDFQRATPAGRVLRYGVREHAMTAIMNGIDAHGGLRAFGATFLNFIGYALGAVRLSAMSGHGVIFVATHDSIGVGEDGPTHQPVELLACLRCMPNLDVWRPADQTETSAAWANAMLSRHTPSVLCLTRQNLPPMNSDFEKAALGGYVISDAPAGKKVDLILVATGSEVHIVAEAKELLSKSLNVRVVSMPCTSRFERQTAAYQQSILLPGVPIVSCEAYRSLGWERYSHYHVGLKSWGASAPDKVLYKHFGITPANVAAKGQALVAHFKKIGRVPDLAISTSHL